mgnify:CR=1 FL=1
MDKDLTTRIDRLESLDEIRQLAAKYSLSLDMRDLDAHVNLFAEDIRVSRDKVGRSYLKHWLDDTLRLQFTGTSHHIGNHIIEFKTSDRAIGVVYSKNEHETDGEERAGGRDHLRKGDVDVLQRDVPARHAHAERHA